MDRGGQSAPVADTKTVPPKMKNARIAGAFGSSDLPVYQPWRALKRGFVLLMT